MQASNVVVLDEGNPHVRNSRDGRTINWTRTVVFTQWTCWSASMKRTQFSAGSKSEVRGLTVPERGAPLQSPLVHHHHLNVLVLALEVDSIFIPTNLTDQVGGERSRANDLRHPLKRSLIRFSPIRGLLVLWSTRNRRRVEHIATRMMVQTRNSHTPIETECLHLLRHYFLPH